MNVILFDTHDWENLLPLTFTRPVPCLRIGILTIAEKWEKYFDQKVSYLTRPYLQEKFGLVTGPDNLYINGAAIPNSVLLDEISGLKEGEVIKFNENVLAFKSSQPVKDIELNIGSLNFRQSKANPLIVKYPWDIFTYNGQEIENDFKLITKNRTSQQLASGNRIIGEHIFVEDGVKADFSTINARDAYVYLGRNAEIMDGSLIKGSLALCENSILKLGAKIYGPTTIGPGCRVGGEVNNSVLIANSNKGHDGFLGNAVLGEWCNLGADTNNSNLKNNYAEVKVWNYKQERFIKTGLQFCGLIMGDHSKCAINTMFNTGTVVGVNVNIFGSGFPRNFIPSFSWGGNQGFTVYTTEKAFETCELVMKRRNVAFDEIEKRILTEVFEMTKKYRK
jgi:UDP-N-acetylglucosamine diphosphorylase/glucosamine-1-phosphate N-acetyltransferase